MALSDWADIAGIVEAFFFVISVFFIWRQLRDANRLARAANSQTITELSAPFNLELIKDRRVAEFWQLGPKNYSQMDEVDRFRYKTLLVWWLNFHENIFYQYHSRLLDDVAYQPWRVDLKDFIAHHNFAQHWDAMKAAYQREFQAAVDELIKTNGRNQ
jgi:hypothetical protein